MDKPRILVFGSHGQVGWELVRSLSTWSRVIPCDRKQIDLAVSTPSEIRKHIRAVKPHAAINAAAYTDVDGAEVEQEKAWLVNAAAPATMAEACRSLGAVFVHYSSSYVFDGKGKVPYEETDIPAPLNHYGRTKLEGEEAIQNIGGSWLILRTSWVYSLRRRSFPGKVLEWARSRIVLRILGDHVGNPTWARSLAEATGSLLKLSLSKDRAWLQDRSGIYNLAGQGEVSMFDWAARVLELDPHPEEQQLDRLVAAKREDFPMAARVPMYSALDCGLVSRTFGLGAPSWDRDLQKAMKKGGVRERVQG